MGIDDFAVSLSGLMAKTRKFCSVLTVATVEGVKMAEVNCLAMFACRVAVASPLGRGCSGLQLGMDGLEGGLSHRFDAAFESVRRPEPTARLP
jgi:hypothetical protein